ncbi:MAG: ATP-binding protein [Caldilineaceae bacterium]
MIRRRFAAITEEEVAAYLEGGQQDHVAFLPGNAKHEAIAETLAALANANGGIAFLGVSAKGQPQKNADLGLLREAVVEAGLLTDPPLILPTPQRALSPKGEVVVIQVPPGLPHLYNLHGRYLTRTASQNRPLTTPELRRLLLERGDAGFESLPVAEATLADLDQALIERYLNRIAVAPDEELVEILAARGCVTLPHSLKPPGTTPAHTTATPTVAGVLLFGRNPQRFMRNAEIICVRYAGLSMSDEFVRQDIGGPLAEQLRQAEAFVVSNMRRGMRINGMQREETTEYPLAVVREAIVNATAHRDYSIRGEGVRVLIFNDRMEVYSPGRLPGHVTLENLKDERYSRNEAIVAVLSDLGYIERLGYGIDRMIATMEEAGLAPPLFEETTAGFRVTLYSANEALVSSSPESQPWQHDFLNERQERAMAHVQLQGRITNSDYQTLSPDVSAETIRRDLADLVEKNLLIRIGSKRATYYILK